MDLNLKDKVALVTGGSHGLGKAVCLALAAEGVKVAVDYYRNHARGIDLSEKAAAVVGEIGDKYGTAAIAVPGDVSSEDDVLKMYDRVEDEFGLVEILVNNAAVCPTGPVKDMAAEVWRATVDVNLTGTFLCCREMVKRLLDAQRPGRIVSVASAAAFRGSTTGHAPYDASKAGIVTFTVSLAREVAAQGIAVNAVAPGMMFTEMTAATITKNKEKYLSRIPLRRIGTTEEVSDVIVFLASERAGYMTGATVDVSGGLLMR